MKIAIAANSAWYLYNFRRPLMQALREAGHEPVAVSPPDEYAPRLQQEGHAWLPLPLDPTGTHPLREIRAVKTLGLEMKAAGFQAAFTYTPKVNIYFGLNARSLGIAHVPNVSGLGRAFIDRTWYRPVLTRLYRAAFQRARAVVFQNDDDRDKFERLGLVEAAQVVRVPGSGVDLQRFQPQPLPTVPPGPIFLFVGRVLRDKGVLELIEATRHLKSAHPNAVVRLLGSVGANNPTAIEPARVQSWVDEGLVEALGSTDDVRPAIAAAHCVVLPSYREGLPRALLEAAAMARPCIATDVPGCRDAVVHGVTGYLCAPRDANSLANSMIKFAAQSPSQWATWGAAARSRAEREFDERRVIDTYLDLVTRLASH